jgi:hypothetical protein
MKYFIFLLSCFTITLFGQDLEQSHKNSLNKYDNYFDMPRESLYLHLNKSSYLRGEHLWFQGYAYDRRNQKLSQEVRNVELRVYDEKGKMLEKQLLLAQEGKFFGQVEIDSTYADGNYFIKVETQWMKNFKEDYTHLQQFEVLSTNQEFQSFSIQNNKSYDLQILPEGGHLVNKLKSSLAIKLVNQNGLGIKFRAKLLENGVEVGSSESNQFGHGVISIKPDIDKSYTLKVQLPNDEIIERPITDIKNYGQVLSVNMSKENQSKINIQTKMPEGFDYAKHKFELVIHQEGNRKSFPIDFRMIKNITKVIDRDRLFNGLNTFTLFYNGTPVAERLVFNRSNIISSAKAIEVSDIENPYDSIKTLKLRMPKLKDSTHVSISILPKNTISYQKNKNIVSTFLLDPFVNGFIEDRGYYFTEPNREKDKDLDLLLLTQGWSKYNWEDIYNLTPKTIYDRKDGFSFTLEINGKVPRRVKHLILFKAENNAEKVIPIEEIQNNTLVLDERYTFEGEKIGLSYATRKPKFIKPELQLQTDFSLSDQELSLNELYPTIALQRDVKLEVDNNKLYSNFFDDGVLDEVVVEAKRNEAKFISDIYGKSWMPYKDKITEDTANLYPMLEDYIRTKCPRGGPIYLNGQVAPGRSVAFFDTKLSVIKGCTFIDRGTRTSDIEEIHCGSSGFASLGSYRNGIIEIKLSTKPFYTRNNDFLATLEVEIPEGFSKPKTFYTPKYTNYKSEAFQLAGTIDWKSNVILNSDQDYYLDLAETGLDEFTLYIEGITAAGDLIYIQKEYISEADIEEQQ